MKNESFPVSLRRLHQPVDALFKLFNALRETQIGFRVTVQRMWLNACTPATPGNAGYEKESANDMN